MRVLTFAVLAMAISTANAECVRTATGRMVCGAGNEAESYNPRTGTVRREETNVNGVKTWESSTGAEAKTKDGMGVYQSPAGTTCVKGRYRRGCD